MTEETQIDLTPSSMTTRLSRLLVTSIFPLSVPLSGFAQDLKTNVSTRLENAFSMEKPAEALGYVKFEGAKYQSPISGQSQLDQSLLATTQIQVRKLANRFDSGVDIKAEKYLDWGGSHYTLPEFYSSFRWQERNSEITLGRKKQDWSQIDQAWDLGMWQPKDTFDGLRPAAQGLTGIFLRLQQGSFEVLGFGSTVFIPSMGPDVKEVNGQFISNTRWYRPPSSTFLLMSKEHRAFYSVQLPETQEFLKQPSLGGKLCYGCQTEGIFVSVNSGYKPMNNLLIKYTRWLYVTEEGNQENVGSAPVAPVIGYHYLGGMDFGYKIGRTFMSFSYLEDRPKDPRVEPGDIFIHQKANPMRSYSAQFQTELNSSGFREPIGLTLGYLRIHGGEMSSFDAEGNPHETPFTQRFNYTHAASIQAAISSTLFSRKWTSRFKYLKEFDQDGMAANAEMVFFPKPSVAFSVGADVLGVSDSSDQNKDDGFLNNFRANDRVYGGVSYVF